MTGQPAGRVYAEQVVGSVLRARFPDPASPINSIDKARAPLMIFQGANDPRVTQAQSDAVAQAFCRTGVRVTYLLAGNEGHGFGNEETALGATRAAEVFLAHELGGRMQQTASPAVQQAVAQMTVKEPCLQH